VITILVLLTILQYIEAYPNSVRIAISSLSGSDITGSPKI